MINRYRPDLEAYIIILSISCVVSVIAFREFLFMPGVVNTGDLAWPYFRTQSFQYTTTLHQLPSHIPYFKLLWLLPVSTAVLERIFYLSVYTLIGTVSGSVIYKFVEGSVEVNKTTSVGLGVVGGLLYLLNPMNVFYASQIFLPLGYALYPLVIYLVYTSFSDPPRSTVWYGLLLGTVVASMSGDPRWPVWSFISAGILLLVLSLMADNRKYKVIRSAKIVSVAGVCSLSLCTFWLLPLFHPEAGTVVVPLTEQSPLTKQMIGMLNADSTWANAFRFHADWWPPLRQAFIPDEMPWRGVWYMSGVVLPVVAASSLVLRQKRMVPIGILFSFFLFLATAPTSSFQVVKDTYNWFVLSFLVGGAFRTAFKWLLPASFLLVLLSSMAVATLLSSRRRRYRVLGLVLVVLLVASAATNSWLLFFEASGHNNRFIPETLSEEEQREYKTLNEHLGEHAVIAFPEAPQHGLPMRTVGDSEFSNRISRLSSKQGGTPQSDILGQISAKYSINYSESMDVSRIRGARRTAYVPDIVISGDLADSYPIQRSFGLNNTSIHTDQGEIDPDFRIASAAENGVFDEGNVIRPFRYTDNWNATLGWAQTSKSYTPTRRISNALGEERASDLLRGRRLAVAATNGSLRDPEMTTMEIPFHVNETGNYKLFARYVKNPDGGSVRVLINGKSVTLETEDRLSELTESELGTFELEKGSHTLTLINQNGVNAITAFSVMRNETFEESHRAWQRKIANETVIHLLSAESDLYFEDTSARNNSSSSRNVTANGLVEMKSGSTAQKTVQIPRNGSYRLAVRGSGNFTVGVDNRTYRVKNKKLELKQFKPIELTAGEHNVSVNSEGRGYLDTVWLYATEEEKTLNEMLSREETNASVKSFERVSATKYRASVDANEPYTLSFAEDYNPLWVAEVHTSSGTKQYESAPLYSVINGFHVNETGEHTVIIRYRPQRWFSDGATVSFAALLTCLVYLGYDWRRRRGTTRTAESSSLQTTTTGVSLLSDDRLAHKRTLSGSVILLTMVLLIGVGLAPVISTETNANRLSRVAYYLLTVGLGLRVGAHVFGDYLQSVLSYLFSTNRRMVRALEGISPFISSPTVRQRVAKWIRYRDTRVSSIDWYRRILDMGGLVLLNVLLTIGGVLIVVWWWLDQNGTALGEILGGGAFLLVSFFGFYFVISRYVEN